MNNQELKDFIEKNVAGVEFTETPQYLSVIVSAANLFDLAKLLRNSSETKFDFLYNVTGIDFQQKLGAIYNLKSTEFSHKISIRCLSDNRENPEIPSLNTLWNSAELFEREVYDFFGVIFTNHPDLRRLYLDDEWVGFPLRKDYVDTINIVEKQN